MARILVVSYEHPPIGGGGSRVVAGLARQLVALGWEVDLVTMGFHGLPEHETVGGVEVHRVPCARRREHHCTMPEAFVYCLAAVRVARRLLKERRHDIVHAHFIFPDGLIAELAARGSGVPCVITAHGTDVPGYNPHRMKLAHRLLGPLWRLVVKNASTIVCPSEHLKQLVEAAEAGARVTVIPNGFDPERFTPRAETERVLVVTRMLERKGIQYLIEALGGLSRPLDVHVVGDGPYLPTLKAKAEQAGLAVRFWGWLDNDSDELKELYETASVFVLPSERENFPVSLLEAMAAETAIITTSGTGCHEVVGDAAWLIAPRDVEGLRQGLEALVTDPDLCRALARRARLRLEERFGWSSIARRYHTLYAGHERSYEVSTALRLRRSP